MSHIQPIGWLDTSLLFANFRLRYADQLTDDGPVLKLHLRDDDRGDLPILTGERKFGSAVNFLTRLKSAAAPFLGGKPADLGAVWIERLMPGAHTPWTQIDEPELITLHIALATNPAAWLYCGGESVNCGVGVINYINVQAAHTAINFGSSPRDHLVINVRRPETPA